MTEPNDLPPVGATVTDADGVVWEYVGDLAGRSWQTQYGDGSWHVAESNEVSPLCHIAWRLQQERDQLKARVAERDEIILQLRRKLAEAGVEGSPPPGVVTTIQQWSSRAHSAEARVAELEKEAAHDKATIEILSDEVRELRGDRDLCERTRTNMRAILDGVAAALKGTPEPLHAHDWSDLPARATALRATLREVAHSGVESDDPRIGYVTVQVDRPTWQAVQEVTP